MKYYKITNNKFDGFYTRDIHGDIVDGNDFFEISDEKWNSLLDVGKEIFLRNNVLVAECKSRDQLILEGRITLDTEIEKARKQREMEYAAYHKLANNIFMGIEEPLTEDESADIKIWHKVWRDVPNNYKSIDTSIESYYPARPVKIGYYYR